MSDNIKNPFFIIEDLLSPLQVEHLVDVSVPVMPNEDAVGKPTCTINTLHDNIQDTVVEAILEHVDDFEEYYGVEYTGMTVPEFEWYPAGSEGIVECTNSEYIENKWVRTKQLDFTGIIFLSSYSTEAHFDEETECYGGKLEFPNHDFGFNPKMGTTVVFPGDMRFLHKTSLIEHGNLYQIRFHIVCNERYTHNPELFRGTYQDWFNL